MTNSQPHPSVEDLTAFSNGQLPSEQAANVESHVGDCVPCCETLMGLSTEDTFVNLLKETRDPVHGATIGVSKRATSEHGVQPMTALADHPRYEIEGLIAKGGMGEVFKAKHRMMDRTVALKVISQELTRNPEAVERFHREVKTAAQMSHRNIVTAFDAEQAEGFHFLVMEHVDGVDLAERVKLGDQLSVSTACDYVRQAANGLQHAHQEGMVHRDIKPHNLMLTTDGTVKILDFGLASLSASPVSAVDGESSDDASLTAAGSIMGTPDFISPEQAASARDADIRSDIYSLGATLYYLLSGQPPFAEGSVAERLKQHAEATPIAVASLRDDVPPELAEILSRMMAKSPEARFQTPQEVADALAPFVEAYRTTAASTPSTLSGSGRSWWPPSKLTVFAFAAFASIAAGVIYLQTNKGTLVIESVADDVEVTISKATTADGEDYDKVKVVDTATGTEVMRLPTGDYKVSLGEKGSAYQLSNGGFTLSRGSDVVIKVTRRESGGGDQEVAEAEPQPLKPVPIPKMAQTTLMLNGRRLSADEVKTLEIAVSKDTDDMTSRLKLLAYYGRNSIKQPEFRPRQVEQLSWLVENYPEAAAHSPSHLHAGIDPAGYMAVKKIWLQTAKNYPENVLVLSNAASFFLHSDKTLAAELLQKAQELEPKNVELAEQLGQLYRLGLTRLSGEERKQQAVKALEQYELALEINQVAQKESGLRLDVAKAALTAGMLDKAKSHADDLLESFVGDATGSNSGNVTHHANMVLGHLALHAGQVEEAGKYLIAAGRTSGSPTLNSFGPSMSLAKALIEKGERDVVLRYFDLCGEFWKKPKLQRWTATVKGGGMPDFGGSQYR